MGHYLIPLDQAQAEFPEYTFLKALTPSAQKAAFHVQDSNGFDLCLKLIAPDYRMDRLQREIRALLTLDHPNVVKLKEYTFTETATGHRHYLVEEFVPGHDLEELLLADIPWERATAARVFAQLMDGLSALDAKSIVHRDLAPRNVRIHSSGRPVVIDFGLARHLDLPDLTATVDGARIGTPIYSAPEQCRGTKRDIDHRTDLFAVGIILYRALTGEHPFYVPGMQREELDRRICELDLHLTKPCFQALPPQWKLLVSKLLQRERSGRPSSASQVAVILRKLETV